MQKDFSLTAENIDIISQEIFEFLQGQKQVKADIIRTRLNVETVLLQWLEAGHAGKKVTVQCVKSFRRPVVTLIMAGPMCDPRQHSEEDEALEFLTVMQGNLGLSVSYKYKHGRNVYAVKLPVPSMGSFIKIVVAILASVATWMAFNLFPADVGLAVRENIVNPTFGMILGLMAGITNLLIFFNVASAICGMGDLATLSKLGGRLMKSSQFWNMLLVLVAGLVSVFVFDIIDLSGEVSLGLFASVYKMFLAIVPNSVLGAFVEGNTLQVLFLGVCSGTVLLILDQQAGKLTRLVRQINLVVMTAISFVGYAVPLIIYLGFTGLLLSGRIGAVFSYWKVICCCVGLGTLMMFIMTYWSSIRCHVDAKNYFAKIMPVSILALTTASTSACIPLMNKTLTELGVEDNYRDFALPLCQTLCVGGAALTFPFVVLGSVGIYHQTLSISELVVTLISIYLMVQTLPPVPGGDISAMTLLMIQVGLPQEAVAGYITINIIVDMLSTCYNKTAVMNVVTACAAKDGRMKTT